MSARKQQGVDWTRSPSELALMRAIKTALDPRDLLNPGKVVSEIEEGSARG